MVGVDDVEKTAALLVPESPAKTCNTSRLKTLFRTAFPKNY